MYKRQAQACTLKEAIAVLEEGMKGTMADYTIASVPETMLMDVFPFSVNDDKTPKSGEELIAEQKKQAEDKAQEA